MPSDRAARERGLRRAALAGDESAWRALYDDAFAGLYAYVLWRCGGLRDHADDAAQETWLTAVRRLSAFDPGQGGFVSWLRGVAANLLRNRFRRRRPERPLRDAAARPAADAAAARERAEQVARALAELPERYEAALRAKYLDGQSVLEMAEAGGETPKAVESLLTRARQAFREAFLRQEGP
jgi:RNA polymerase sigma-70 factor (ECF subfamily)